MVTALAVGAPKSAVQVAIEEMAKATGENPSRIRPISAEWATVLADGFIVELTIESGSFETPLNLRSDLGVAFQGVEQRRWEQYVRSHGTKLIFPKAEIREIERLKGVMRNLLIEYAMNTSILKHGRMMPLGQAECFRCGEKNLKAKGEMAYAPLAAHTAKEHKGQEPSGKERGWWYLEWKGKQDKLTEQYMAEAARLAGKYDELYRIALADAATFADDAFARLLREGNAPTDDQQEFIENYVLRPLRRRFPSRAKMESDFKVEWTREFLPLASVLAEDQAKATQILADAMSAEKAAVELARAKTEVERDVIESRRAMIGQFRDFVSDMEGGVRSLIYERTVDALAILDRNDGVLPEVTARNMVDIIKSMDALQFGVPDEELEQQMGRLRTAIAIAPRTQREANASNTEAVFEGMARVAAGLRLALNEIGRPPANRREKLTATVVGAGGAEAEFVSEQEFDPGARVGIPASSAMLKEMAEGRVRRVRAGVAEPEMPTLVLNGRQRRVRETVAAK